MKSTVTSKGQITLPKDVREKLGLSSGDRVEFFFEDDQSVRLVAKQVPVSQLKGMLPKPAQPVSLDDMDRAVKAGAKDS